MKRLYISGPMSGIAEHNFPAFREASIQLRAYGDYLVEDPSAKGVIDGWTWEQYLRHDLLQMLKCDGVATLPGFAMSKGAMLEISVARQLAMPVHPVDWWISESLQSWLNAARSLNG